MCGLLVGQVLVLNFLVWKHDCVCLSYVRICLSAFDPTFDPTFDFTRCNSDRENKLEFILGLEMQHHHI